MRDEACMCIMAFGPWTEMGYNKEHGESVLLACAPWSLLRLG